MVPFNDVVGVPTISFSWVWRHKSDSIKVYISLECLVHGRIFILFLITLYPLDKTEKFGSCLFATTNRRPRG